MKDSEPDNRGEQVEPAENVKCSEPVGSVNSEPSTNKTGAEEVKRKTRVRASRWQTEEVTTEKKEAVESPLENSAVVSLMCR